MTHHSKALLAALCAAVCLTLALPSALSAQDDQPAAGGARKGRPRKGRDGRRRGKKAQAKQAEQAEQAEAPAPEQAAAGPEAVDDSAPASKLEATPQGGSLRRSNKMEFDARLVRGETAGTGAVVLFDRGQRELPALTAKRTGFLRATVEEVYADQPPAAEAPRARRGRRHRADAPAGDARGAASKTPADAPADPPRGEDGD